MTSRGQVITDLYAYGGLMRELRDNYAGEATIHPQMKLYRQDTLRIAIDKAIRQEVARELVMARNEADKHGCEVTSKYLSERLSALNTAALAELPTPETPVSEVSEPRLTVRPPK